MSSPNRYRLSTLPKEREYVIVGLDPGTTTAVAIIGLNGELFELFSSRTTSILDIIRLIASFGHPLIVASDVTPTPSSVEKVKRAFDARLYNLATSLPVDEKIRLAKPFDYDNEHERDALAAALEAYKGYKNKFEQIEKKTPDELDAREVKALVVRGLSIDSAISTLKEFELEEDLTSESDSESTDEDEPVDNSDISELKSTLKKQEDHIRDLKEFNNQLKSELESKENELIRLRETIEDLKSDRSKEIQRSKKIRQKNKEIARLKRVQISREKENLKLSNEIDQLKRIRLMELFGRIKLVKVLDSFARDSILKVDREYGINRRDVIYLKDATGGGKATAKMLIDRSIKAVICGTSISSYAYDSFIEAEIPVFSSQDIPVRFIGEFSFVDLHDLERGILEWKDEKDYSLRMKKMELLESIVDEYKTERGTRTISKHL
ncbi:MAG: DUF460 domain-containing protein [Halobacteriota archaeon]|nr:DUF460 domain-containing protein [Halobacteriota archaeon]